MSWHQAHRIGGNVLYPLIMVTWHHSGTKPALAAHADTAASAPALALLAGYLHY